MIDDTQQHYLLAESGRVLLLGREDGKAIHCSGASDMSEEGWQYYKSRLLANVQPAPVERLTLPVVRRVTFPLPPNDESLVEYEIQVFVLNERETCHAVYIAHDRSWLVLDVSHYRLPISFKNERGTD